MYFKKHIENNPRFFELLDCLEELVGYRMICTCSECKTVWRVRTSEDEVDCSEECKGQVSKEIDETDPLYRHGLRKLALMNGLVPVISAINQLEDLEYIFPKVS